MWCQSSQSGFVSVLIYKRLSPWWHSMCLERLELSTLKSVVWYSIQLSYKHSLLFTPLLITPLILTPLILTWHLTDLTKGQDTPWLTNLRFVYLRDSRPQGVWDVRCYSNTVKWSVRCKIRICNKESVRITSLLTLSKGSVRCEIFHLTLPLLQIEEMVPIRSHIWHLYDKSPIWKKAKPKEMYE